MERIVAKKQLLKQALSKLEDVIQHFESAKSVHDKEILRDSLIKRFEFCFDLFWKVLKEVLRDQYGLEIASPKKVFMELFTQKIYDQEIFNALLAMTDDRNATVHIYDESTAHDIAQRVPSYYKLMKNIISSL